MKKLISKKSQKNTNSLARKDFSQENISKSSESLNNYKNKVFHYNDKMIEYEKIEKETDRDYFLSAEEAKNYGLIDRVITHPSES